MSGFVLALREHPQEFQNWNLEYKEDFSGISKTSGCQCDQKKAVQLQSTDNLALTGKNRKSLDVTLGAGVEVGSESMPRKERKRK